MLTLGMLIATAFIVCGLFAGVMSVEQTLADNPIDW